MKKFMTEGSMMMLSRVSLKKWLPTLLSLCVLGPKDCLNPECRLKNPRKGESVGNG